MLWKLNKNLMKSNHPDRFVTLEFADLRAVAIRSRRSATVTLCVILLLFLYDNENDFMTYLMYFHSGPYTCNVCQTVYDNKASLATCRQKHRGWRCRWECGQIFKSTNSRNVSTSSSFCAPCSSSSCTSSSCTSPAPAPASVLPAPATVQGLS